MIISAHTLFKRLKNLIMDSGRQTNGGGFSPQESPSLLAACPRCDLLVVIPNIPAGRYLECGRCGSTIAKTKSDSINRVLVLSLTGLMLYLPAILLPLLTLSSLGFKEKGNVIETAIHLFEHRYYFVALMVLFTAILVPFFKLLLPFVISLSIKFDKQYRFLGSCLKLLKHIDEWGMIEVYLLGILITLIKMGGMASITYNAGFFCFIGLVILTMAAMISLDYTLFWENIAGHSGRQIPGEIRRLAADVDNNPDVVRTASSAGLARCHDCALLVRMPHNQKDRKTACPRCGSSVHLRKPGSISKTWALVITSVILFIPANTLPIMQVNFLGIPDRSTILDGIIYFFKEGSYGIGLIIFSASVLVPLFKIIGLIINLITTRSCKNRFLKQKTAMFRFIEFIGRWSMLDIFVISLLTVLVNFGFFTSIHTAPAATYFCIVVVCTMCAAIVFDPRIMWDCCAPISQYPKDPKDSYGSSIDR